MPRSRDAANHSAVRYHILPECNEGANDDETIALEYDLHSLNFGSSAFVRKCWRGSLFRERICHVLDFLLTSIIASLVIIVVIVSLSVGLGLYAFFGLPSRPSIDLTINAFSIPNHEVTRHKEALDVALEEYRNYSRSLRARRGAWPYQAEYSRLEESLRERRDIYDSPAQYIRAQRLQLVYLAVGGDGNNIFTRERIATIHHVESAILNLEHFSDFCYMEYGSHRCSAVNSLVPQFYRQTVAGDAVSEEMVDDLDDAVRKALSTQQGILYTDGHVNNTHYSASTFLRSELLFGMPLKGYSDRTDRRSEQDEKFKKFLPSLVNFLSHSSTSSVRVLYGGNEIFDYQVSTAFWNDMQLAIFAVVAIILLMLILTSFSIWLTFWGLVTIVLSFPLAFFMYRVVFGINALGLLNGVAAFVVIGIGVDDVFVFINVFRQAHSIQHLPDRMLHMLKAAGKATFFTSFTTAAAFAANMASSIPAIHDFGLFMTLIVTSCWVLVILLMPPVINLWYRWFACCESVCNVCCPKSCTCCTMSTLPNDIANFFMRHISTASSETSTSVRDSDSTGSTTSDSLTPRPNGQTSLDKTEDDDQLLDLELTGDEILQPNGSLRITRTSDGDDDDPLLQLDEQPTAMTYSKSASNMEGCKLNLFLQNVMYNYVALPVVKARWGVFVVYGMMLVISIGCMTQLRPATKPPRLFRPDSNLQMLLDLMANYTSQSIPWDIIYYRPSQPSSYPWFPPSYTKASSSRNPFISTDLPTTTHSVFRFPMTTTPSHLPVPSSVYPLASSSPLPSAVTHPHQTSRVSVDTDQTVTTNVHRSSSLASRMPSSTQFVMTQNNAFSRTSLTPSPTVTPAVAPTANIPEGIELEKGVTITIVFGIRDIDRRNVSTSHVVTEKGSVVYENSFSDAFDISHLNLSMLSDLCRLCNLIANNSDLVKSNTGQCLPPNLPSALMNWLNSVDECRKVPRKYMQDGVSRPSQAKAGLYGGRYLKWIVFYFESKIKKGMSSFAAYKQYQQWQSFLGVLRETLPAGSPLRSFYQTSDFWIQVIMEVVAVSSAVYGLALSLLICIVAIAMFTGHFVLLIITVSSMLGMVFLVVSIFFWVGWELGAIEAISLSILVGSSVDYCVHVVEGYLLAGHSPPPHISQGTAASLRQWRARVAVTHIGASVISSALTTIAAALPLTQTLLLPFSRFGQIVAINAAVSVVYSLTACVAFLALFAPSAFVSRVRTSVITFAVTSAVVATGILVMFAIVRLGDVHIPGPSGTDLFAVD